MWTATDPSSKLLRESIAGRIVGRPTAGALVRCEHGDRSEMKATDSQHCQVSRFSRFHVPPRLGPQLLLRGLQETFHSGAGRLIKWMYLPPSPTLPPLSHAGMLDRNILNHAGAGKKHFGKFEGVRIKLYQVLWETQLHWAKPFTIYIYI